MRRLLVLSLFFAVSLTWGAEPVKEPILITKPEAFKTLVHPHCSHCQVEGNRRKADLKPNDPVLAWMQVATDGYINDGVIPLRFFLNPYRVLDDTWGQFVYDPDAGFARGFALEDGPFRFHGWRNGVMVMKSVKDGSLYSCLSGLAFSGPKKGHRLEPRPTLVSTWGYWQKHYPLAVAFTLYDKFQPVELPAKVDEDSKKSRGPADGRLPAETLVLGVWDGKQARAYPIDVLEKGGVIHDTANGQARVILWDGATRTAAAYRQPWGTSGLQGDAGWIFRVDKKLEGAPFVDQRTGLHWDITGRPAEGGPRLAWMDSVQVKWFAWSAEHPETSIFGQEGAKRDYKPMAGKNQATAGPLGNLNVAARQFAILKDADPARRRVTLQLEGDAEAKVWPLSLDAEIRIDGWWGRLEQFSPGDRVWVWFDRNVAKQNVAITFLADELSEQDLYGSVKVKTVNPDQGTATLESKRGGKATERAVRLRNAEFYLGDSKVDFSKLPGVQVHLQSTGEGARLILDGVAFEKRRALQKSFLRNCWVEEGLPGSLVFSRTKEHEVEIMLDHESMFWARTLETGEKVILHAGQPITATVQGIRPWRERTQVLLSLDLADFPSLVAGRRISLRLKKPLPIGVESLTPGLGKSARPEERLEWILSGTYCTCGMHDGCAGQPFTLGACQHSGPSPCGLAKRTREEVAALIAKGKTDQQILEELLKERGPRLLRNHLLP